MLAPDRDFDISRYLYYRKGKQDPSLLLELSVVAQV